MEYNQVHDKRFKETLTFIKSLEIKPKTILEIGQRSTLTELLEAEYGCKVEVFEGDIRRKSLPKKYDLILFTEVIEHLNDIEPDESFKSEWDGSGIKLALASIRAMCNDRSVVVCSTPNLGTYKSIANLLYGEHPFMYKPHPRELMPGEVDYLFREIGFEQVRSKFVSVWNNHSVNKQIIDEINMLSKRLGININREDNYFSAWKRC